ncbi:Cytochrome oxidase biogenesis protein Sco1/SenC/PrrC, thiol-disulfide reductase involved in Cu(I) insertion into CoxII Cu(A) center [hydrothermal vent metagenome]|uniref:Cytochrome oxidase biogenesis protein Sco1/SenC/PrrC, thiol-disulfide reductase involved in Cu(I) insertion into CoxII Cu(A) center n=1 Tax=hydrothermal vent metagenome TaxID=652676 RepID=A0A3B0WMB5_9ZZZZ
MAFKTKFIYTAAAVVAMSGGYWLSTIQENGVRLSAENANDKALAEARKKYSPIQGSILSPARKIAVPALTKDDGSTFVLDDLKGEWHLLFFGYTHCPDVCPVTMGVAAQAKKIAEANNHIFPQVIFVSVDPDRDKVEMLADYVQYFDKDFIGVTGDSALIKALTLQLSVVYLKMAAEAGSDNYLVDHSSALLLLNPEGKLVAFMNPPHDPKTILKDFQTVVNGSNES